MQEFTESGPIRDDGGALRHVESSAFVRQVEDDVDSECPLPNRS